jgi:hypothetical protein
MAQSERVPKQLQGVTISYFVFPKLGTDRFLAEIENRHDLLNMPILQSVLHFRSAMRRCKAPN